MLQGYTEVRCGLEVVSVEKQEQAEHSEKEAAKAHKAVSLIRFAADCMGFEVSGRIWLRSKESGKEYR